MSPLVSITTSGAKMSGLVLGCRLLSNSPKAEDYEKANTFLLWL
jgi:hypothetical protein